MKMSPEEIRSLRQSLQMTQDQFAQLMGMHSLTVSKWERGILQPNPYQAALMQSFKKAKERKPDIGDFVKGLIVGAGIGIALYHLLNAAFEEEE